MALKIVHTEDLMLYAGTGRRCRCDGVNVIQNYDQGARHATQTTDADGLLPDTGLVVSDPHANVRIKTGSTYWRNAGVKAAVTWTGDSAALGILAIHLEKR